MAKIFVKAIDLSKYLYVYITIYIFGAIFSTMVKTTWKPALNQTENTYL